MEDKNVFKPTEEELKKILTDNKKWVETVYEPALKNRKPGEVVHPKNLSQEGRANLFGADLSGANLYEANLREANLGDTDLSRANLSGAELRKTHLSGAKLESANLSGANLMGANLSGAHLAGADLSRAKLGGANLHEAGLRKADLSGTNLENAALSGADLKYANLSRASLRHANLNEATLEDADLSGADLWHANLIRARLQHANLSRVALWYADLSGADLDKANLSGANLGYADLSGAHLGDTDLSGVNLWGANLDSVRFELKLGALPRIQGIALAKNLSKMRYVISPHSLVELRAACKNAGLRRQEREITYAIERTKRKNMLEGKRVAGKVKGFFKFIFFELTSKYGLSPGRPLWLMFFLFLTCLFPYWIALNTYGEAKIVQYKDVEQDKPVQLSGDSCVWRGFWRAAQFSLLSSFSIGWQDITPGYWLVRMQGEEYTLKATGWARSVSGVQSLISCLPDGSGDTDLLWPSV